MAKRGKDIFNKNQNIEEGKELLKIVAFTFLQKRKGASTIIKSNERESNETRFR